MQKLTEKASKTEQRWNIASQTGGLNGHQALDEPRSEAGLAVSEAVYWQKYYEHPDFNYEWNNGILEEKPVADVRNAAMYRWLLKLIEAYLEVQPIAQLVNLEIGFRLALPDKTTIRKPDLFVVRNDNSAPLRATDRTFAGICDLCIESLSDADKDEIERDTIYKKAEYATIGVREYYILHASDTHMAFYYRLSSGNYAQIQPTTAGVIRSTVLPGLQFRIADLHRQPSLIEMTEDSLYQAFVLPEYQAQKMRAQQAEERAERLAAKLRELGIEAE
ncbi:MAG: Uma2 family endonuclease [Caldilineaceae bacterium]